MTGHPFDDWDDNMPNTYSPDFKRECGACSRRRNELAILNGQYVKLVQAHETLLNEHQAALAERDELRSREAIRHLQETLRELGGEVTSP